MKFPPYDQVNEAIASFTNIAYSHWINDEFLTWKWWLLLFLTIVPWFIWWKIVDKKRVREILLFGLVITILTLILDDIGTGLLWWGYPDKLAQLYLPLLPADLTLVPIYLMIIYQYFNRTFQQFLIATIVAGALSAFVFETFFIGLNYYQRYTWRGADSWLFYIVASLIGRYIVTKTAPYTES